MGTDRCRHLFPRCTLHSVHMALRSVHIVSGEKATCDVVDLAIALCCRGPCQSWLGGHRPLPDVRGPSRSPAAETPLGTSFAR